MVGGETNSWRRAGLVVLGLWALGTFVRVTLDLQSDGIYLALFGFRTPWWLGPIPLGDFMFDVDSFLYAPRVGNWSLMQVPAIVLLLCSVRLWKQQSRRLRRLTITLAAAPAALALNQVVFARLHSPFAFDLSPSNLLVAALPTVGLVLLLAPDVASASGSSGHAPHATEAHGDC